jgi:inner membrane protease subunit 1
MSYLGHPFRVLITCGKVLACAHVFWTQFYSIGWGQGPSMIPTFLVTNESMIISKRYRRGRGVQVGDVVDYDIPVEPGQEGVKRVVGMPGDYVLLNSPGSKNDNMVQVSGLFAFSIPAKALR